MDGVEVSLCSRWMTVEAGRSGELIEFHVDSICFAPVSFELPFRSLMAYHL